MKQIAIYSILILTLFSCGQKNQTEDDISNNTITNSADKKLIISEIKSLNGIWVAENYYNSFEKTRSAVESKSAFPPTDPAALRINSAEIKNGVLNVGCAIPHDHFLRPEVSKYAVVGKDTIHEDAYFEINLFSPDSLDFYKTSKPSPYFYWTSYFKWNMVDTSIILYRPPSKEEDEKTIKYVRVKDKFEADYPFPNPLYYYVRSKTLVGDYVLKDSLGKVLAEQLKIQESGIISGYNDFENRTAYFSTDVYCGGDTYVDFVIFCKDIITEDYPDSDCLGYSYKKIDDKTIHLFKGSWYTIDREEKNTLRKVFELIEI